MDTQQIITLALAGGAVLWIGLYYNHLIALNQRCETAFSDIDVQLKHRHNVIPGLIETVRGIMGHERSIIDKVAESRSLALAARGPAEVMKAETQLGNNLSHLFALAEQYPDIKASGHFRDLRNELSDAENRITAARRFFNLAVEEFNVARRQFPGNIVGAIFGLAPRNNFILAEDRRALDQPLSFKV